jgi:rsbT antagonist protein RsbS
VPRAIPIIKLHRVLIVSIQIELRDDLVADLKQDLAHQMRTQDVEGLVIEVSGADLIDSYIARTIRDIGQIGRLLGVRTVLVGLDPAMATTLVEMGAVLRDIDSRLDLEAAMESFGMTFAKRTPVDDEVDELLGLSGEHHGKRDL